MTGQLTPSITALTWITGEWVGTLGDQTVEEVWSAPLHGCLENKVRLSNAEGVVMIELMMVREGTSADGKRTLTLRLRQFDEHLEQLTEQQMTLAELTASRAAFTATTDGKLAGLSYTETRPGEMQIDVTLQAGPVVTAMVTKA